MQHMVSMDGSAELPEQRANSRRWLWWPTGLMVAVSLALGWVEPRWSVLGLGVASLWAALFSLGLGIREGMRWGGSGLLGNGPDLRLVGLFSGYRQRSMLLGCLTMHLAFLALAVPALGLQTLDPADAGFLLLGPLFTLAAAPFDGCNWWMARRYGDRPSMRQALALWTPAMLIGQMAAWIALDLMSALRPAIVQAEHYAVAPVCGAFYLLALVCVHRSTLAWQSQLDQANERADAANTARRLAEAQLTVLQAQIEPHFLYNTLATVQYLLKGEPNAADFLLTQLIRYLRLAMPSMRQFSSTLAREFELTDAYLKIARLRMGGRLDVTVDLSASLEQVEFPPLVLQTLVENAIKHGVEPKVGPVRIRVFAARDGGVLRVCVQDDGVGLGGAATQGSGTGLQNIRERLKGIYGERARLEITGLPEGGVRATVTLQDLEPRP